MTHVFDSLMVRTIMPALTCVLQLFAVYVLMHGHYSPGGGFQAGVMLGASFILPTLLDHPQRRYLRLSPAFAIALGGIGVLIFTLFALQPLAAGHPMLDYAQLPLGNMSPAEKRSLGILGIEIGVTLGVAGAVVSIYQTLRGDPAA